MVRRWLSIAGKVVVVAFVLWQPSVVALSSLPDRSTSEWVQSIRATLLPYTNPYAFWTGQWQSWGMFSEGSVTRVFKHEMQAWDEATQSWHAISELGFHDLPFMTTAHETALLRTLGNDNNWLSRERYLQLKCIELGRPTGEWVRMNYPYFDMPFEHERTFDPAMWENWEPELQPWPDNHATKCPDPDAPMDTWPVPQDTPAS